MLPMLGLFMELYWRLRRNLPRNIHVAAVVAPRPVRNLPSRTTDLHGISTSRPRRRRNPSEIFRLGRPVSTEYSRRGRGGAATRPKSSVSDDRSPRNIHVAAAAAPRPVSTEHLRHSRGAAATRPLWIPTARSRRYRNRDGASREAYALIEPLLDEIYPRQFEYAHDGSEESEHLPLFGDLVDAAKDFVRSPRGSCEDGSRRRRGCDVDIRKK